MVLNFGCYFCLVHLDRWTAHVSEGIVHRDEVVDERTRLLKTITEGPTHGAEISKMLFDYPLHILILLSGNRFVSNYAGDPARWLKHFST